jgi:putative spermidine/putrescine transport system permease protein
MTGALRWLPRALGLALLAWLVVGPLANLVIWSVAEAWFWPNMLPSQWGFRFWAQVFRPTGRVMEALSLSLLIAVLTVVLSLALAIPAGYALARLRMPARALIMLAFLMPQAFPSLPVYINIARAFYEYGLNGTVLGVVLVHATHGLVYAVWIAAAAFGAIDRELEQAARNLGASAWRTFVTVTLPLALPGLIVASIFVFLESLDEFTGAYFVGAPDIQTLPLLMFTASMAGSYQISSITALILLVPSLLFMVVVQRFLRPEVMSKIGT